MAGSGRGRGRSSFTFNIEAIGFAKGAALPADTCEPPPTFPSTENKAVPLKTGEAEDYMLALKQDFRATMKRMPYFLAVEEECEVIERYSKKYQDSEKKHATWTPDWRRLPRELKPKEKTKKAGGKPKKAKSSSRKSNVDVLKKIEELEKKDDEEEKSEDEKDETKDKNGEDGEDDEAAEKSEESDEEENEEENDYISSYFEDGDDFGASSDDNMDEATY
ncbi:DNA-directed RNA polymerase III subunit RPC7 [Indicator indicator]|uniref:DNA-directed RNA polymerase III subunit RPC7 n=1 Tax=Indicator indicator TaxID=1002788 RepID=UPI0023DF37F0|nr:DNA-directed RNA polymerase III subunit RPC7 [Indicator indicator]